MNDASYSTASDADIALGFECALPWTTAPALARVNPVRLHPAQRNLRLNTRLLGTISGHRAISRNSSENPTTGAAVRSMFIPKLV